MTEKKRRGWPERTPEPGERVPMSFRVTPEFKERLDTAAKASGRSLSQEIEIRLEASFRDQRLLYEALDMAFGRQGAGLLMLFAKVMNDTGLHAGFLATGTVEGAMAWLSNPYAFEQVCQGIAAAIGGFRPRGEAIVPDGNENAARLGKLLAAGALEALKNPDRGGAIGDWAAPLRGRLADATHQITVEDDGITVIWSQSLPTAEGLTVLATARMTPKGGTK